MQGLRIQVYENQQLVHSVECPGAVELGRQAIGEGAPYLTEQEGDRRRVVVARLDEVLVSRRWLVAEPLMNDQARITNLSGSLPVPFMDGTQLDPGASRIMPMPTFVVVGDKKICIHPGNASPLPIPKLADFQFPEPDQGTSLHTLAQATLPPGAGLAIGRPRLPVGAAPSDPHNETMIRWLQAAMDVLQSAASSSEFYDKAASALVDLVGLDSGQVLLFQNAAWRLQAIKTRVDGGEEHERPASGRVLGRVLAEKRTFWQAPAGAAPQESLVGVNAVVAAPILDKKGDVIGALYGNRQGRGLSATLPPITKLEALLVELLAGGVATGIARIEHENTQLDRAKRYLLYEREMEIGRKIQLEFLPNTLPQPIGWEVVAHFQPARAVAGDFYDVFPLSKNHIAVVMADVCDKGVGAALFMALFRSLIRSYFMHTPLINFMNSRYDPAPADTDSGLSQSGFRRDNLLGKLVALLTVEHTNRYVTTIHPNACMFVTLFLGVLNTTTGELTYVNAGHDSPTILGPEGIKARLEPTGPVVGLTPEASFDLSKTLLEPGDILLTHTDGVTDARDPAGKSFSEKRYLALIDEPTQSAATVTGRIVSQLRSHIAGADQFDDITLLAIRREPEPSLPIPSPV